MTKKKTYSEKRVYVIEGSGKCKIGIGIIPESRLKSVQVHNFDEIFKLAYQSAKHEKARLIERLVHRNLKWFNIKGEWFSVDKDIAIKAIREAIEIVNNGSQKEYLAPKTYQYKRLFFSISKEDKEKLNLIRLYYQSKSTTRITLTEVFRQLIEKTHKEIVKT